MSVTLELFEDGRIIGRAREHILEVGRPAPGSTDGGGLTSTELLLLALGSCMVGNLRTYAAQRSIALGEVRFELQEEVAEAPSRIARINVVARLGENLAGPRLAPLVAVANRCKIHNTLREGPHVELKVLPPVVKTGQAIESSPDERS